MDFTGIIKDIVLNRVMSKEHKSVISRMIREFSISVGEMSLAEAYDELGSIESAGDEMRRAGLGLFPPVDFYEDISTLRSTIKRRVGSVGLTVSRAGDHRIRNKYPILLQAEWDRIQQFGVRRVQDLVRERFDLLR